MKKMSEKEEEMQKDRWTEREREKKTQTKLVFRVPKSRLSSIIIDI